MIRDLISEENRSMRLNRRGRTFSNARVSCPVGADWSRHEWTEGIQIEALQYCETLLVRTRNSTYEIMVLCPATGDVLVRGGWFFPEYTPVRLAASSLGGRLLERHGVYVGFGMQLQCDRQTILTTRVRSLQRKSGLKGVLLM
jgi:hypothetical protein